MSKVKVKLLADNPPYKAGDICEMSKSLARMSVNSGNTEYVTDEKPLKVKKEK